MTLPLFDRTPIAPSALKTILRPYQDAGIKKLRADVARGLQHIMLTLPTAGGKMVIIAHIIKTATVPVLFVAHRMELIDQCAEQLASLGITNIGVMRADDERTNPSATVQIASIQTLIRRDPPPAGLILIDEAHRSASDSYREYLFKAYPNAIIIGFTATPCRHDEKPLGDIYQALEVVSTYSELIRSGFIVEPDCWSAPIRPDLSDVKVVHGDYEEGALGDVMSQAALTGQVVEHWLNLSGKYPKAGIGEYDEGPRRRTFLFAVNIRHSTLICEKFEEAGVRIAHLDGTTPEHLRRAMLRDIDKGEIEIISNCNVLLEGVDVPSVKCVVHARPTRSLVLYMQSVGRMLRPWCAVCRSACSVAGHASVRPLLLDHAGNFDRHGAPHEDRAWSLSDKPKRASATAKMKLCKACFAYVASGKTVCPYCGYEWPRENKETKSPKETKEALSLRDTTPEGLKQAFFDQYARTAKERGYKPGWVGVRFKEKYGAWPPWAWSEALKADFASNPYWQKSLTRREEERAAFETNREPKKPMWAQESGHGSATPSTDEPEYTEEPEEDDSFAAWVEDELGKYR